MNLVLFHGFPTSPSPFSQKHHSPLSPTPIRCNFKPNPIPSQSKSSFRINPIPKTPRKIPPTDIIIDFGTHKGKMLGTLPSKYLKWVSKTLRARDYEEWAKLADEVLQDPVYKDRLEWELAEKILTGDDCNNKTSSTRNPVSDLLDVSVRFGWDNDDKVGWSKIDFALLGTSKSARIPRRKLGFQDQTSDSRVSDSRVCVERERGKREERIERQRLKRGGLKMSDDEPLDLSGLKCKDRDGEDPTVNKTSNPFPGRDSLFKRAVDRRRVS